LDSVREDLARKAPDIEIIKHEVSTATVMDAALAHGCEPGQIAKTLSLRLGEQVVLLVARGDARLDNKKAKAALGAKPRMLGADEVEAITGHPVGGVSPFGLASELPVYCDISLKSFEVVIPAAGDRNSSLRIAPDRLAALVNAIWVDACE
jgi:prolyl-tRNA editing enzyme YbaK/EbsC (Cys-tRNA(Pro) deacylase)